MTQLSCDVCGAPEVRAQILLEGAKILACGRCMKMGKILHRLVEEEEGAEPVIASRPNPLESSEEVVEDFAKKVRYGREKLGLPLAVVAERINEKESFIHAVESGRINPTIELAKKLEKELGMKFIEKVQPSVSPSLPSGGRFSEPTLADMIEQKKKKEK